MRRFLFSLPAPALFCCAALILAACLTAPSVAAASSAPDEAPPAVLTASPVAAGAPASASPSTGPPLPAGFEALAQDSSPEAVLKAFEGVPYRMDGALNEKGEFTLFADQSRLFATPGLNCSGLTLAVARFMLGRNIGLDEAMRDRMGDSGPGAPGGQDWDFGWDLILNISEGFERRFILPGGQSADPADCTAASPLGWSVNDPALWRELPPRLLPGRLYLLSMTMRGRNKGYGLQHYHVGLIHVDGAGRAWFCQTTGRGKAANLRDLNSKAGQQSFMRAFGSGSPKKILVLEVELP